MDEEFFCVFTERCQVPSLFDCIRIQTQTFSLNKPAAEQEAAVSEAADEANYTKYLCFGKGEASRQEAKLRQFACELSKTTYFVYFAISK